MSTSSLDQNSARSLTCASSSNGSSVIRVLADPTTHRLKASDSTTGTDYGPTDALRDENDRPTLLAVSSADGVTPVVVYADSNGVLLIDSN